MADQGDLFAAPVDVAELAAWLVDVVPKDWVPPEMVPPAPLRGRQSKATLKAHQQAEQRWQKNQETLRRWLREYGEAAIRERFPGFPMHRFTGDLCYLAPVGGTRYYRSSGKLDGTLSCATLGARPKSQSTRFARHQSNTSGAA
jgi:hypothetical protein